MTLVMHLCSLCNRRTINFYDDDNDDDDDGCIRFPPWSMKLSGIVTTVRNITTEKLCNRRNYQDHSMRTEISLFDRSFVPLGIGGL